MSRGRRVRSLYAALAVVAALGVCGVGLLAYRRPEHLLQWLALLQWCGV